MTEETRPDVGTICWQDLSVPDADRIRDFYRDVVGWESEPVDMGGYEDHQMIVAATGEGVAGVCHARGSNADLPAQWLIYITVEDVDASAARCTERGGDVIVTPRKMGGGRFCVIRDPAGAVAALYEV